MSLTRMTELEAVNTILRGINVPAVNSLSNSGDTDVTDAHETLKAVSREVQSRGWNFNTLENFKLSPDTSGHIQLPVNTLRIDTTGSDYFKNVIQRENRLYNKSNNSDVFESAIELNIVEYIPFEEIPETARDYITKRASRQLQDMKLTDRSLSESQRIEERDALIALENEDGASRDDNMGDTDGVYQILMRTV